MHKRTSLKNRAHAILFQHGLRAPIDDLFGVGGRRFLERRELSEPWRSSVTASLYLIDVLEEQIDGIERELRPLGAENRYLRLLMSAPGIGWVLGDMIAAEIGEITRFARPAKLINYIGPCPRVHRSGEGDRRGALSKHGSPYLRWALIAAARNAIRCYLPYRQLAGRQRARLGRSVPEVVTLFRQDPIAGSGDREARVKAVEGPHSGVPSSEPEATRKCGGARAASSR